MTDRTTINVSKAARDDAREAKRDDETWSDYLRRCAEADADTGGADVDPDALAEAVAAELDALRDPASMAADPGADGAAIAEEIIGRLDDLEARLPRKVAEEVRPG